jgi:flagellar biosynthesis component FlhA
MNSFDYICDSVKNREIPFYHEILELNFSENLAEMLKGDDAQEYYEDIRNLRNQIERECGVAIPKIRLRDDCMLVDNFFVFHIRGVEIFRCRLDHERYFFNNSLKAIDISIRSCLAEVTTENVQVKRQYDKV